MTNETQQRIEAYQKTLPQMKERVMAVAILLVMSISMMVTASFAWLTISRSPEVSGASTSVTANGNLEIALANSKTAPEDSKVGDSSATKGQDITLSNITWGNLVNLSDPDYGLDNLTLRPAQLNQSSLLESPLYGAVYQGDGRVEKLNSNFAYATWDQDLEVFKVSTDIGVRAISSTTVEIKQGAEEALEIYRRWEAVQTANLFAGNEYIAITNNKNWMDSLALVMGTYMTARLNAGQGDESLTNPTIQKEHVQNLTTMFGAFVSVYDLQYQAMTELANYQLFLKYGVGANKTPYTEKTVQDMRNSTEASLKKEGIQITGLNQVNSDYKKLQNGYERLQYLCTQGTVKWADSNLNDIINSLVVVGECTLDGTPINNIGVSNAMGYLDGKAHNAVITNGVLYNLEKLNGTRCDVKGLKVSASVKRYGITVPATISANITTNAPVPSQFAKDMEYADTMKPEGDLIEIAQDTYGLAVDLWVRTNAPDSYLVLEGNILTKSEMVRATGKDTSGNTVDLYTLTRSINDPETGEATTITLDLYKVVTTGEDGEETTTWYNASNYTTVALEEGENPTAKMEELVTVIGYEGENRIWEDANAWESNSQLSLNSTTQGSGSCYVYYADSPEDQARSLKLLEAMNVAFVDEEGKLMATAVMDTEHFYAENGRVIVPLVLKNDGVSIGMDGKGNEIYAITALTQNEPKRIMAIVYLDGTKLTNQDVLAASDIQGKLNIQFGSSVTLSHAKDEALLTATRSVSASVTNNKFRYDEALSAGTPMSTQVTVTVDGDKPTEVTAFFIRAISSTQGSREAVMNFTEQADGTWKADYTFTAPGNYILRSVQLDGQTYDLTECPTVTIEGFAVQSLECIQATNRHVNIMTANSSSTVDLKLQFASDRVEAMPSSVQGRFLRNSDGTAVNINFKYNASGSNMGFWTGQATFLSSGEYTLEYLVLNGEYVQLDEGLIQTASVYTGMKTAVYTDSPVEFKFVPGEMQDNQKNLYMKVKIKDNTGKEMEGLQNVRLYYMMEGSSIAENGYSAQLSWDAAQGYYTGTFLDSKVGIFRFSHVTVDSNTITYAEESPVFRIISPEPPSYIGFTKNAYVYSDTANITMNVRLSYSSTATVAAMIRNLDDNKLYEVQGTYKEVVGETNVQAWSFRIPVAANGKQDGNWQLETVKVWNYYDKEGNYIKAELDDKGLLVADGYRDAPLTVSVKDNITKAVNTINVKVNLPADYDAHLGNRAVNENNVTIATATADFMEVQTVTVPSITITDFEGKPIGITAEDGSFASLIRNVRYVYDYDGQSAQCGGYTSANVVAKEAVFTVNMSGVNDMEYEQAAGETVTVVNAGGYTPKLLFEVNGKTYTMTAAQMGINAPSFRVWSKKPVVTITGTNPAPGTTYRIYTVSEPSNTDSLVEGDFFRYTDYTAGVYIYTPVKKDFDEEAAHAYAPEVTMKLSGVPAEGFNSATMVFETKNAQSVDSTFTFGSDLKATAKVGDAKDGKENWLGTSVDTYPKSYPAGRMSQNKITVVYHNISYEIILDQAITIDQPQSPAVMIYEGIPDTYTGTRPGMAVGDGSVITTTLPSISWTAYTEEPGANAVWSAYTAIGTNDAYRVYTMTERKGTLFTYGDFQYYDWTTFRSECTDTITYYKQNMQISKWIINGKEYAAGEKISIEAEGLVTAKAVVTPVSDKVQDPDKAPQETTAYKYQYGYVKGELDSVRKIGSTYPGSVHENFTKVTKEPKLAVPASANAAKDIVGTNMTLEQDSYLNFLQ